MRLQAMEENICEREDINNMIHAYEPEEGSAAEAGADAVVEMVTFGVLKAIKMRSRLVDVTPLTSPQTAHIRVLKCESGPDPPPDGLACNENVNELFFCSTGILLR